MNRIWHKVLVGGSKLLPDFNNYLLKDFRKDKMNEIVEYLCTLFTESVRLFDGVLKFTGYEALTPEEHIEYVKVNRILRRKVEIQNSTFSLYRFNFEFENEVYPIHIQVPYMEQGAVILSDTKYYPLFAEVDKGGLHITNNDIIVSVMRAKLSFRRDEQFGFVTVEGTHYTEYIVTARIHQRRISRTRKNSIPPIILYNLVKMPFYECMEYYGFSKGEILIVPEVMEDENYSHVKITEGIYLRISNKSFEDKFKRRVIASYMMAMAKYPDVKSIKDLTARHSIHYKIILGKYTYPSNTNVTLLHDNAEKHLETTDLLLDPPAQHQLKGIGIQANNIYELLKVIFYNIDSWMVGYDPTDLYEKKLGALDQIMAPLVTAINTRQFGVINNKKSEGLTPPVIRNFCARSSQHSSWFSKTQMFRPSPHMCNDNTLLSIGCKRFRSLENIELKTTAPRKKRNIPVVLLKAHPSHLVVESILAMGSSSPIRTGEINPYLQIDTDGNIIKPNWAENIKHIFD